MLSVAYISRTITVTSFVLYLTDISKTLIRCKTASTILSVCVVAYIGSLGVCKYDRNLLVLYMLTLLVCCLFSKSLSFVIDKRCSL